MNCGSGNLLLSKNWLNDDLPYTMQPCHFFKKILQTLYDHQDKLSEKVKIGYSVSPFVKNRHQRISRYMYL